jgi:hypothetical protein
MSEIASIASSLTSPPAYQAAPTAIEDGAAAADQAGSSNLVASTMSIQESYQSMSVSVGSRVDAMMAQLGAGMPTDELLRALVLLLLLQQLLEQMNGSQGGGDLLTALGQAVGQNGQIFLASESYDASFVMESSSYQMTATEVYLSGASLAGGGGDLSGLNVIQPTDAGASMNAGDGGHQLDVVA